MTEYFQSTIESVSFWFKISGMFIELNARIITVDKPYPFEETYVLSYEQAQEYFNNFEIFLVNNFEREEASSNTSETTTTNDTTDVDTNTPILTKEKAIEEMIGMGVNVVFR